MGPTVLMGAEFTAVGRLSSDTACVARVWNR